MEPYTVPPIPSSITTESTIAVLFMVVLGIGFLALLIRSLPGLLAAWRGPVNFKAIDNEVVESLRVMHLGLSDVKAKVDRCIERVERFEGTTDGNMVAIRKNLHDIREWLIALEVRDRGDRGDRGDKGVGRGPGSRR
jgi:hypothetical protein